MTGVEVPPLHASSNEQLYPGGRVLAGMISLRIQLTLGPHVADGGGADEREGTGRAAEDAGAAGGAGGAASAAKRRRVAVGSVLGGGGAGAVEGAAEAQKRTGAPILILCGRPMASGFGLGDSLEVDMHADALTHSARVGELHAAARDVVAALEAAGATSDKIWLSGMEPDAAGAPLDGLNGLNGIADGRGFEGRHVLSHFGKNLVQHATAFPSDAQLASAAAHLAGCAGAGGGGGGGVGGRGGGDGAVAGTIACRVSLSTGTHLKMQLEAYGGHGLAYVVNQVVPRLRGLGMTESDVCEVLIGSVLDELAWCVF